ncbi:MAG: hypothetical protein ABIA66_02605 [Candidatus Omnitrophota bacterium]
MRKKENTIDFQLHPDYVGPSEIYTERRKNHLSQRFTKHTSTSYKDPEDFPQWKAPEEVFDLQQFMQEIM